jgi:hypothetical protein
MIIKIKRDMKDTEFKKLRSALTEEMTADGTLCKESVVAIKKCENITELVNVLNKFRVELRCMEFPTAAMMRRLFSPYIGELNCEGVYIDQEVSINRTGNVWLFGKCRGSITSSDARFRHVIINDDSELTIYTSRWALMHVLVKNKNAEIKVDQKDHSRIMLVKL